MSISDALTLKILVLGDSSVGKSCFIQVLKTGQFAYDIPSTMGVSYTTIKTKINNEHYDVHVWDTAGQEKYRGITKLSCRFTDCAIICFDLSKADGFDSVPIWIQLTQDSCPPHTQIVVVGTKCDLEQKYSKSQLIELERGLKLYNITSEIQVTSAAKQEGIKEAFVYACRLGAEAKYKNRDPSVLGSFILGSQMTNKKSALEKKQSCC